MYHQEPRHLRALGSAAPPGSLALLQLYTSTICSYHNPMVNRIAENTNEKYYYSLFSPFAVPRRKAMNTKSSTARPKSLSPKEIPTSRRKSEKRTTKKINIKRKLLRQLKPHSYFRYRFDK